MRTQRSFASTALWNFGARNPSRRRGTSLVRPGRTSGRQALPGRLLLGLLVPLALTHTHCGATSDLGTVEPHDICSCLPIEPEIADYRHLAKHVPLPNIPAEETDVDMILSRPQGLPVLPRNAPPTG